MKHSPAWLVTGRPASHLLCKLQTTQAETAGRLESPGPRMHAWLVVKWRPRESAGPAPGHTAGSFLVSWLQLSSHCIALKSYLKNTVTFLVSLLRGIYSTCVLRLESGGYEERNSEQVAEIHVHLCSPISLPSPPSPSFPSLVPNPPSTIPGRHVPGRTFHFHWGVHVVAARPTGVLRALVGCKHGDRWCSGKGSGVRDSPWHYSNLPLPDLTARHVHISTALRN